MTTDTWNAFVDAYGALPGPPYAGMLAVDDTDLPGVVGWPGFLRVVLTGGAGQLAGPAAFCERHDLSLDALDTTLRDLDDPAGNARRVVTAAEALPDDTRLYVRVSGSPGPSWLAALDVLAEAEAVVTLPLGRLDPEPWVDAALDRELRVALVGGAPQQAVDALRTTARLWGDADDLQAARRWCLSWLVTDADAAVAHLGSV